ncbi:MAG: hypothetical protein NTV62_01750 [Candidatus Gribaldobacteria bacterium]|nr:hypothetical protein [Candidatus Gribaldobacteria bacterium]
MEEQDILKILQESRKEIQPSQDFARKMLASLDLKDLETKRSFFDWKLGIEFLKPQQFLTTWKIALPLALIALMVTISQNSMTEKTVLNSLDAPIKELVMQSNDYSGATLPSPVSLKVQGSDADMVLAQAQVEQSIINQEASDINLVSTENQLLTEFGQIYDENQF